MNLLEIKKSEMDFGKNAEALRAIDDVSFTIGAVRNGLPPSAKKAAAWQKR